MQPYAVFLPKKMTRLIEWNADVLRLLKQIAAARSRTPPKRHAEHVAKEKLDNGQECWMSHRCSSLLKFNAETARKKENAESIGTRQCLSSSTVLFPASLPYQDNPFHNHCVTMSVVKLLTRIVAPSDSNVPAPRLHETYGMTSDPLTQFACVFSALSMTLTIKEFPTRRCRERTYCRILREGASPSKTRLTAWRCWVTIVDLRAAIYGGEGEKVRSSS
jgi:hypothetical protein